MARVWPSSRGALLPRPRRCSSLRDCRNRRMRFQHRDYDNGRYLDEPNFRSNFIHQSTYSTVKSSLVQDQGNTSLKYIESQSRLLLIFLRLPNTPRQTKRAKDHRRKQSDKEGDRKILQPPTHPTDNRRSASIRFLDLTSAGSRSAGDSGIAVQSRQRLRASHDRRPDLGIRASSSQLTVFCMYRLPSGARIHLLPNLKDRP